MSKYGNFFAKYGINNYCLLDYQDGSLYSVSYYWATGKQPPPGGWQPTQQQLQAVWNSVFLKLGLRVFNRGASGNDSIAQFLASASPKGAFLAQILYPFGYAPQDSGLAQQNPALQEYFLIQNLSTLAYSLTPLNGIVIDNQQQILPKWQSYLNQVTSNSALIGLHDADLADDPINWGNYPINPPSGYKGLSAGHNINSYLGFIKTTDYTASINSSGNHVVDNTPCLLFTINSSSTLTTNLALDVDKYHYIKSNFGGNAYNYPSGNYGHYLALNFAQEEVALWNYVKSNIGNALMHSAIGKSQLYYQVSDIDPFWFTFGATVNSVTDIPNPDLWFRNIVAQGGIGAIPSFADTWAATAPTSDSIVYNYFLKVLPLAGNMPVSGWLENVGGLYLGSTYIPEMLEKVGITTPWGQAQGAGVWPHFGSELVQIPYVGGWYGWENDTFALLAISHHVTNTSVYQPLYNVAHMWGADPAGLNMTLQQLNNFKVIFIDMKDWFEPSSSFWTALQQWVSNGGTLVFNTDGGFGTFGAQTNLNNYPVLMQLLGVTSLTSGSKGSIVINQPNHPILQPYGQGIINAYSITQSGKITAASSVTPIVSDTNLGPVIWENKYGNGKAIAVSGQSPYSNNFNTGPVAGYYWLVINAIAYAGGMPTPVFYFANYQNTQPISGVVFTMHGTKNGQKLLWISNSNTSAVNAGFKVSSSFFSLGSSSYQVQNVLTGQSFNVTGDLDLTTLQLPAQEWVPLLIGGAPTPTPTPTPTQGQINYKIVGAIAAAATLAFGAFAFTRLRRRRASR